MINSKVIFLQNWQEVRKLRSIINIHIMHTPCFITTEIPVGNTWRINLESREKHICWEKNCAVLERISVSLEGRFWLAACSVVAINEPSVPFSELPLPRGWRRGQAAPLLGYCNVNIQFTLNSNIPFFLAL